MARRRTDYRLAAPYLRRVWLDRDLVTDWDAYPFALPLFRSGEFAVTFDKAVTIIAGDNGAGKSTILEGIARLAGFPMAGGSRHHMSSGPGGELGSALRAAWLPKVTDGYFMRGETFFVLARYLEEVDEASGRSGNDYLDYSHGEGFLRFFEQRFTTPGLYILDEPEAALSPARQIEFLRLIRSMQAAGTRQLVIATHAPILMACPDATLLRVTKYGLEPTTLRETDHFRLMREFYQDPEGFIDSMLS